MDKYIEPKLEISSDRSLSKISSNTAKFFNDDERIEYYNLPRQSFPQAFNPNGYIDILRNSTIKTGQLHGNIILGFKTEQTPDIDAEEDFKNALNLLNDFRFKPIIKYLEDNYK